MALLEHAPAGRTLQRGLRALMSAIRVKDWWDYKLTPPLAVFWATALHGGKSLLSCWQEALALVASIAVCAAYVSLINNYFDRVEDGRSGKPSRLPTLSDSTTAALVAFCAIAGALFLALWREHIAAGAAYLGSWITFTLYSAPPMRLKTRGLAGMIADAAGASAFPCVLAVLLALKGTGQAPEPVWFAAVGAWSFGWGLRGIAWHQLGDLAADRAGGVATFAARYGAQKMAWLTCWVAVPLEISGLAILLWWTKSLAPLVFLLFYVALMKARRLRIRDTARPLLLDQYYDALLPVALVAASAAAHPIDLWLLIPLLLLFGRRVKDAATGVLTISAVIIGERGVARLKRIRRLRLGKQRPGP